jgi:hypothetical protein
VNGGEQGPTGSRLTALRETAIVVALGAAALWLIPRQTTSGAVLGLPPAFLPKVCAVAIIALALIGLAMRLWQPQPLRPERLTGYGPVALILAVVIVGVVALQWLGPLACGLLVMGLGPMALGERRMRVLAITLACTALLLSAVFQTWR